MMVPARAISRRAAIPTVYNDLQRLGRIPRHRHHREDVSVGVDVVECGLYGIFMLHVNLCVVCGANW